MWTSMTFWIGVWVSLSIIGITAVKLSKNNQSIINFSEDGEIEEGEDIDLSINPDS